MNNDNTDDMDVDPVLAIALAGMSRDEITTLLLRTLREQARPHPTARQVQEYLAAHGPHAGRWDRPKAVSWVWDVLDALRDMGALK